MQDLITPPSSIIAEASLLGCLLLNSALFDVVDEVGIVPDDFYEIKHQHIFNASQKLYNEGKTPNITTVADSLQTAGIFDATGGIAYLIQLTDELPISSEQAMKDYADIIVDRSLHRKFINLCNTGMTKSYKQEDSFDDIVDNTTTSLINLSNERSVSTTVLIKSVIDEELAKLKERIEQDQTIVGISSGYHILDSLTAGFKPGEMIVLAGRPGMGKTAFALNMAAEIAKNGNAVMFFSLEMPREQLVNRIIAAECSINSKNFMTGKMEPDEINRLWHHIEDVSKLPIYIDDASTLTISALRSKAKKLFANGVKLSAIFVDYLQLMKSNIAEDNRVRQIEDISRNIKLFSKDLGLPIIALAQLSRKVEERSGKKIPMLSDLRDSGAIEQDADVVMFIHREEMYDKETNQKGIAEIHLQKNRHGSQGVVPLSFIAKYTKFGNLDPNAIENYNL